MRDVFLQLFGEALTAFLEDAALDEREVEYLNALHRVFDLSQAEVDEVEERVTHPRLGMLIRDMVADGSVDHREKDALQKLRATTRLADPVLQRLMREAVSPAINRAIATAVEDRRLTDAEWADLQEMAQHLGYHLEPDHQSQLILDRCRLLWKIDNGELPSVDLPSVRLQRGEVCHFAAPADWRELRSVTRRISYAGPTVSIPIVKGVRFRLGSIAPRFHRAEELQQLAAGTLYITNKRLFFDGLARNSTLRLAKVTSFQVFDDAIVVEKDSGRSPHFFIHGDVELAAVVLSAVLAAA